MTIPNTVGKAKDEAKNTPEDPEFVWHFTTQEGLPAILLDDVGLLAGHSSFMEDLDDASFSRQAVALIMDVLRNHLVGTEGNEREREKLVHIARNRILSGAIYPFFIACFSTRSDDVEMWQARTSNGGFAIQIRYREFKAATEDTENGIEFKPCTYDETEEGKKIINQIGAKLKEYTEQLGKVDKGPEYEKKLSETVKLLHRLSMELIGFKKPSLRFENEIRLVRHFATSNIPFDEIRFIGSKPFITIPNRENKRFRDYVEKILVSPFGDVAKSLTIASLVAKAIGKDEDCICEMQHIATPLLKEEICQKSAT